MQEGVVEEKREELNGLARQVRDTLGEDTLDFRMKSSRVKADQVKETGAKILVTACENCHTQLMNLNDHYEMGVEVKFLSSMITDALVK